MSDRHRRLSDKIILAHRQACGEGKMDVAEILLRALEVDLSAIGGKRMEYRKEMDMVEEVFERHMEAMGKGG
jgi:hypothetical protein